MGFLKGSSLYGGRLIGSSKFLQRAALVICGLAAGNLISTSNVLAGSPKPGQAESQAADGQIVKFPSGDASVAGYLAKPKDSGKHAAVLIVHDSGGLNDATQ